MNNLVERVSYLKGLVDGLGINEDTKEGKVLLNIIDVLDDIVNAVSEIDASQSDLDEYIQAVDDDLGDVEEFLYGDYDDDSEYIEVECPHCHQNVYFDDEIFDSEDDLICPNCHNLIYSDDEFEDNDINE
ncbi:MAG: TFIIB-type domain-containing protein [Xylanivirga thermophila]|nr:CD1247 N-terminal domain-containing protein [Xylanivirga thermophila]